jgi:DNA-binding GntR family transcriptional regulator
MPEVSRTSRPRISGQQRATALAYETLKRELLDGVIRPGERIVDADVCKRLSVSRTPVREALLALERDGLVRILPRQGYFASEISVSDALDAYQLRFILEPVATALAARRITPTEVSELRELLDALADVDGDTSESGLARAIDLNKAFHVRIAEASGNSRLARILSDLLDALGRLVLVDLRTRTSAAAAWRAEHLDILAALEAGDPERAVAVVRESFQRDEGLLFARARDDLGRVFGPEAAARSTSTGADTRQPRDGVRDAKESAHRGHGPTKGGRL